MGGLGALGGGGGFSVTGTVMNAASRPIRGRGRRGGGGGRSGLTRSKTAPPGRRPQTADGRIHNAEGPGHGERESDQPTSKGMVRANTHHSSHHIPSDAPRSSPSSPSHGRSTASTIASARELGRRARRVGGVVGVRPGSAAGASSSHDGRRDGDVYGGRGLTRSATTDGGSGGRNGRAQYRYNRRHHHDQEPAPPLLQRKVQLHARPNTGNSKAGQARRSGYRDATQMAFTNGESLGSGEMTGWGDELVGERAHASGSSSEGEGGGGLSGGGYSSSVGRGAVGASDRTQHRHRYRDDNHDHERDRVQLRSASDERPPADAQYVPPNVWVSQEAVGK